VRVERETASRNEVQTQEIKQRTYATQLLWKTLDSSYREKETNKIEKKSLPVQVRDAIKRLEK
jgi:hypothetical protein